MSLFSWMNAKIPMLKWYDISLIKLASAAFALLIAKIWPPLLTPDWPIFAALTIAASVPVCVKMLRGW